MREFPLDAAARYLEETGKKTLSVARTPYVPESLSPKGCELTRGRSIFSGKDQHELVYQGTSPHKGDMCTKRLDPCAFERALRLINLKRPDGSSFKVV